MNRFYAKGKKPTHVLMDGGTLHVTPARMKEFNEQYCHSIRNGIQLFVVEQKTPCYKLFVDIDYVDDEPLTYENIKSIIHIICDKASTFMKDIDNTCIISVAKPKPKNDQIKTGVHLNWPGCIVNQEIALNMRDQLIFHLSKIYSAKNWGKIIDQAVFGNMSTGSQGSGFRLPWSHKKAKDTTEGPYIPFFVYKDGNVSDITNEPITVERLEQVTIRTHHAEPNMSVEPVQIFKLKHAPKQMGRETENPEASAHLETFVRKYMTGQSDSRITKLYKDKNTYAIQTTSRYCENLGREHSSNHVWFLVNKKSGSICQKCFCTCETTKGRKYKMCKDFSGREHLLPKTIMYMLYPEKQLEDLQKLKKLGIK